MLITETFHHVYNRGAHKAPIFNDSWDYYRMLKLLYIANNTNPFEIKCFSETNIFEAKRDCVLVDIVAYCLMPNHFHLAVHEKVVNGISIFIHKLATGYSGYYNKKYDHSGTIWQGSYNDKEVNDEIYIRKLINYIHLNPYALETPEMSKEERAEHIDEAINCSIRYEYSSFREHEGENRLQSSILSNFGGFTSGGGQTSE